MIRFEEVQERILDQVQARIKPVANKAIEALADKATDPVLTAARASLAGTEIWTLAGPTCAPTWRSAAGHPARSASPKAGINPGNTARSWVRGFVGARNPAFNLRSHQGL